MTRVIPFPAIDHLKRDTDWVAGLIRDRQLLADQDWIWRLEAPWGGGDSDAPVMVISALCELYLGDEEFDPVAIAEILQTAGDTDRTTVSEAIAFLAKCFDAVLGTDE